MRGRRNQLDVQNAQVVKPKYKLRASRTPVTVSARDPAKRTRIRRAICPGAPSNLNARKSKDENKGKQDWVQQSKQNNKAQQCVGRLVGGCRRLCLSGCPQRSIVLQDGAGHRTHSDADVTVRRYCDKDLACDNIKIWPAAGIQFYNETICRSATRSVGRHSVDGGQVNPCMRATQKRFCPWQSNEPI